MQITLNNYIKGLYSIYSYACGLTCGAHFYLLLVEELRKLCIATRFKFYILKKVDFSTIFSFASGDQD